MRYAKKYFKQLPTDAIAIAKACQIPPVQYIRWEGKEKLNQVLKEYNRARGKMSMDKLIAKLNQFNTDGCENIIQNLISYIKCQ